MLLDFLSNLQSCEGSFATFIICSYFALFQLFIVWLIVFIYFDYLMPNKVILVLVRVQEKKVVSSHLTPF